MHPNDFTQQMILKYWQVQKVNARRAENQADEKFT
jgi:hypothetical protein